VIYPGLSVIKNLGNPIQLTLAKEEHINSTFALAQPLSVKTVDQPDQWITRPYLASKRNKPKRTKPQFSVILYIKLHQQLDFQQFEILVSKNSVSWASPNSIPDPPKKHTYENELAYALDN
jgi:hypothetical protein